MATPRLGLVVEDKSTELSCTLIEIDTFKFVNIMFIDASLRN